MKRPIVVGIDGSAPALQAASWAGQEAALREAPLRIVHVAWRWTDDVPLAPEPSHWGSGAEGAAWEMLHQAAVHAQAGRPRLRVETELLSGRATEALVKAAEEAQLLVVGNHGRGGFSEELLGSVSRHVVARAPCPVAVVRQPHSGAHGEVVVGVSGQPGQEPLLEFAFREASVRCATLRAVHAWVHPGTSGPGDTRPGVHDAAAEDEAAMDEAAMDEAEALVLTEAIAGWREKFPDVTLVQHVTHEHPAQALIEASRGADVVALGAYSLARSLLGLGRTARAVLDHSRAPVVVVPPLTDDVARPGGPIDAH